MKWRIKQTNISLWIYLNIGMHKSSTLTCVFLFLAILSNAQVREISGLVTFSNQRLNGASIKNLKINQQTISNERGEFVINAKTGDTLVAFKTDFVTDTIILAGQQYLIIRLHKPPSLLKTVIIHSTAISPESVYEANKKEYKDIYVKGDKSGIIVPGSIMVGLGFGIDINIDKIYNAVSKEGKDARRLQRNLTKDYKNSIIDKRFNPLAASITGYKGNKLKDFIMNYRPSYEMVIKSSDYDIIQYIKRRLSEGKKG